MAQEEKEITDTQRLDAIESGFCVTAQDERTPKGWVRFWSAAYGSDCAFVANTLREAIDQAIVARYAEYH